MGRLSSEFPGLKNSSAYTIAAGELEAVFLPSHGMLGASLRHRGVEILRRVEDLEAAAAKGSTAGIPLLHPWANRLAGYCYRAARKEVNLDPSSRHLHFDENRLPIHGVPWSQLAWDLIEARKDSLVARLQWTRDELLAVFPFPHRLDLTATLQPTSLTLETTLTAGPDGAAPVSFGFHPYFGIPGLARGQWRLQLPAMLRLVLNQQHIPTGEEESFESFDGQLGDHDFDDCFALLGEQSVFTLSGAGRRITVELLAGYRYAQVFAPRDKEYVALEPMTAPANALASNRGLHLVAPGETFSAAFRIYFTVETT